MKIFKNLFKKQDPVIKTFNGRQISHITKRVLRDGTTVDEVVATGGRVAEYDGYIKITANEKYVFVCPTESAKCNFLLSGNGATIEGQNEVSGTYDKMMVHYAKF